MKLDRLATKPEFLALCDCRAIDGDSIEATILLPLGVMIRKRIRLKGFYAPEILADHPDTGIHARNCLQADLDAHVCHISCHGIREDKYGRLCATLWLDSTPADPHVVLGGMQMTKDAHQAALHRSTRRKPPDQSVSTYCK